MYGNFFQENYLTLVLTLKCNLNCFFCPIRKRNISLSFKSAQKAVDFFLSLKGGDDKIIKFFGGEPILEFNLLKKIVLYLKSEAVKLNKKIRFVLTTNGLLLNKEVINFFKKYKIELTLSSHHLKKINKKILSRIINFPAVCLNIDILPEKIGDLYSDFINFYHLGFHKFNLLPVYYVFWPEKKIKIFKRELEKIKDFCFRHPDIHFVNQELIGEVPLFNSGYTLDPEGNLFSNNIILSKQFDKFKNFLFLGNIKDKIRRIPKVSLKEIIEKELNNKIWKSTLKADEILNDFVNSMKIPKTLKKADLKVGYSCNNHCKFCVQGRKRELFPDKTTEEIKEILKKARKNCQEIVFTGGEPTIRPDFMELARFAKSLGFKRIQVQTNGRMFAYRKFCREAIAAGINEFGLSLHGHIPELHNYLTSSESFYETVQAIKNLKELGQPIPSNTVITKSNYRHLPEIAQLLVSLNVDQFQFAFVHPLGSAQENFSSIVPRMSMVIPYVKKGLDIGIAAGKKVMTEAIPYCLMSGYEEHIAERLIPSTEIYELDTKVEFDKVRPTLAKIKGNNCRKCRYNNVCEGTWREYPEKFGFSEFKPVEKKNEEMIPRRLEQVLENLIKQNNLGSQRKTLIKIWRNLFENFNPEWLTKNQKFDFSFSAREKPEKSLRFSYNNYGEKENFKRKVLKLFNAVDGGYDLSTLKKILSLMGKTDKKHQTTVGLEWLANQRFPRFKVYFEELFHTYSKEERLKQIKNICNLIGIDYSSLRLDREPEIGAFCVDFLPNKKKSLKVYLLVKKINQIALGQIFTSSLLNKSRKYLKLFLALLNETKCFYYITKRFDEKGDLVSWKLYKIYEVKQINDFKPLLKEILAFLNKIGFQKTKVANFIKLSRDNKFLPYPVIFSLDFSKDGVRADSYFSLK